MVEAIVAACQPPAYLLTVAKAHHELENSREKIDQTASKHRPRHLGE
jgi:hypothetical protein